MIRILRMLAVLALLVVWAHPSAAQTAMFIDSPTEGSTTNLWRMDGWAVDSRAGTGSGIDAVHIWLWPQPTGGAEWVGAATLGDTRTDVAAAFGNPNYTNAGWHLIVTTPRHPGDSLVCAYAHRVATNSFDQSMCRRVTVNWPDPYWPSTVNPNVPMRAYLDGITVSFDVAGEPVVKPTGWAVRGASTLPRVLGDFLIDDWFGAGQGALFSKYRPDVCPIVNTWGWPWQGDCQPVETAFGQPEYQSHDQYPGIWHPGVTAHVGSGWHYIRAWVWTDTAYGSEAALTPSNAIWFWVN